MPGTASARSRVYNLLATGLAYPDNETWETLKDGRFAQALADAMAECGLALAPHEFADLVAPCSTLEELEVRHLAAFEAALPAPRCSLHEGDCRPPEDRPKLLMELKAFYRCFGLAMTGACMGMEDHLTVELEFMHFLAFHQDNTDQPSSALQQFRDAEQDFLQHHLADWVPALAARYSGQASGSDLLGTILSLAARLVSAEQERLAGQ
ncbi:MAG: molecular chaperone TorD family protein [Magnetospirillum sp.]|nr:molecular chaperone TorD family protein [Magnetospirillum sp.]